MGLPSSSSSFLQIQRSGESMRREAQSLLEVAQHKVTSNKHRLDFILLALHGRKGGLNKIVKLIDDLVSTLKTEQNDDNDKREYCNEQFDQADDKKKGLERTIAAVETVIAESTEGVATVAEELKALKAGIVAVDKQVSEATEQRKEEEAAHKELMQSNTAAKELILFAKNRLNKFYNPKLATAFVQAAP